MGTVSPCVWQGWSIWNALVFVSLTFDMVFGMMEWFCAPRLCYEAMAGHRRSRLHFWRPFSSLTDLTVNRRNMFEWIHDVTNRKRNYIMIPCDSWLETLWFLVRLSLSRHLFWCPRLTWEDAMIELSWWPGVRTVSAIFGFIRLFW